MKIRILVKKVRDMAYGCLPSRVSDGSSLILAYHNIVQPTGSCVGDSSLHLSAESFESQLKIAREEADLVSLPELLSSHGKSGVRIAITFDDAYKGCISHGLQLCSLYGVRPTIFVAPDLLGMYTPWDVRSMRGQWSESERWHFLSEESGIAAAACTKVCDVLPDDYRIARIDELREAAMRFSLDIGNHTMKHINMAVAEKAVIVEETASAQAFLEAHFGDMTHRYLAYPYGNVPAGSALGALANLFDAAFLVSGGWIDKRQELASEMRLVLNRLNIPAAASIRNFRARLRGRL